MGQCTGKMSAVMISKHGRNNVTKDIILILEFRYEWRQTDRVIYSSNAEPVATITICVT